MPLNIAEGIRVGPGAAFLEPAAGARTSGCYPGVRATRLRAVAGRVVGVDAVGRGPPRTRQRWCSAPAPSRPPSFSLLSGIGPAADLAAPRHPGAGGSPVGQAFRITRKWVMSTGRPLRTGHLGAGRRFWSPPNSVRKNRLRGDGGVARPGPPDVGVVLTRPADHGRLMTAATDPDVAPRIEHRYDSHPACGRPAGRMRTGHRHPQRRDRTRRTAVVDFAAPVRHKADRRRRRSVVDPRCRVHGVDRLARRRRADPVLIPKATRTADDRDARTPRRRVLQS